LKNPREIETIKKQKKDTKKTKQRDPHLDRNNDLERLETQVVPHPPLQHARAVRAPQPQEEAAVIDLLGRVRELDALHAHVFLLVRE